MGIELSESQRKVLEETAPVHTPESFNLLRAEAESEMRRIVREVMEPSQATDTTLTELRDLYLTVVEHQTALVAKKYGPERRALFRDAIRLADTAQTWFGAGVRAGQYRPRTVAEVVAASRPWRAEVAAIAGHAFVFEPEVATQFADVNSTGTLDEERSDIVELNRLIALHDQRLREYGLTMALVERGKTLLEEADGRDLVGILGLRNHDEAITLRNRLVTYAVLLGREVRAAGVNACFHDEPARRRFEKASFRQALRRLRPSRRGKKEGGVEDPTPSE
jgi:hypothetical protein